ncbi:HepT-like ribonuclease domain-containing protein [Leifsonia sp. 22587]|uniref:HepT-like ribonuclease domain-containing protein n=1 Tax=Leifsonia sp. 22587 TaxID=3453946 RepID=UPI003F8468C4
MLHESPAFLWDAREAATKAASVAEGHSENEYLGDWVLQAAVERQLEILGEALKNLRTVDAETAGRIPDVHAIIATRNILVHAYAQVDQRRVWEIHTDDLPHLIPVLAGLLAEADDTAARIGEHDPRNASPS